MLWPEQRKKDIDVVRSLGLPDDRALSDAEGYLYRTTAASCFIVPQGYLPDYPGPRLGAGPYGLSYRCHLHRERRPACGPHPQGHAGQSGHQHTDTFGPRQREG